MNQKKNILLVALTILSVSVKAQTYTQAFDSVFFHISRADATSGILYERVLPFGNLTNFNSQIAAPDTSNYSHFLRAYRELYYATFNSTITLIPQDSLKKIAEKATNIIQIA